MLVDFFAISRESLSEMKSKQINCQKMEENDRVQKVLGQHLDLAVAIP